jgi:hypothetical protein
MAIRQYVHDDPAFGPDDIQTMSLAMEDVCKALNVNGDARTREAIAIRIIELARRGERDRVRLREQVIAEANGNASL